MILDCFLFSHEIDILEGRLEYLYDSVDYFIIVESNLTHSGESKSLKYLENKSRYKKYLEKILYFPFYANRNDYDFTRKPVNDHDFEAGTWKIENAHRNYISEALKFFPDNATVIISDLDEIPHKSCIPMAEAAFTTEWLAFSFNQTYFAYNFNQRLESEWRGSVITKNWYARQKTPQWLRYQRYLMPFFPEGGWHLTYWGTVADIQKKLSSFAHQELNNEKYNNLDYIKQHIAEGKDLFERGQEFIKSDRLDVPEDVRLIFEKYQQDLDRNNV